MNKNKIIRNRILAIIVSISVMLTMFPLFALAETKGTGPAQVLTTTASGDNNHLRLNQTAKWLDKQKTEVEVTFKLDSDAQTVVRPKRQDIVFVVDQSGSMFGQRTYRIKEALKESTTTLLGNGLNNTLGLVQFSDDSTVLSPLGNDSDKFFSAIENLRSKGRTLYAIGLKEAQQMLAKRWDKSREPVIIFMSDGLAGDRDEAFQTVMKQIRADKIETYAVQYLAGPRISDSIMKVAGSRDRAYNADELDSISSVYRQVIGDVMGEKAYTEMKLDIPVDTDNYTIVSATSSDGNLSRSGDKAVWTAPKYTTGRSTEIRLRLKLKDTSITGYLNNLTQSNLTYMDPDTGTQALPIDTTVLDRVAYRLHFDGNLNTSGTVPEDMNVVGGIETSLPYNPKGLTKDGEVFTGWSLDGVQQSQPFTMPAGNTTLKAVWGRHEVELNTTTFAPLEPVAMAGGTLETSIAARVSGADLATKVEVVNYIPDGEKGVDLSAEQNGRIRGWKEGDTLYLGCSEGPISAPESSIHLFRGLSKATEINFNGWFQTDKVTNMAFMFYKCSALEKIDCSDFNTENVTAVNCMFDSCRALTTVDIRSFNLNNVKSIYRMFYSCDALSSVYVRTNAEKTKIEEKTSLPSNANVIVVNPSANRSARLEATPDTIVDPDNSAADNSVAEEEKNTDNPSDEKTTPSEEEPTDDVASMEIKPTATRAAQTTGGLAPMAVKPTATKISTKAVTGATTRATTRDTTRATVDPTLIDGGKIKQNDVVDYVITVKYYATAESRSNRIKVTNKMPEGMTYLKDSVFYDVGATRIIDDGGKLSGKVENVKVENNVVTFDVVGLSDGAKIRVGYKTTATKAENGTYYEFLNQASGTLQGLGQTSNFVSHHYAADVPPQKYTLTYNYAAGSPAAAPAVPNPKDYVAGQVINLPTPSMPGYTFNGWEVNDGPVTSPYTMPASNVTLTGSWTQVDVIGTDIIADVTYEFDGDIPEGLTPPAGESYTVGTKAGGTDDIWGITVNVPTVTEPDGYTFGGWTSDNVSEDDITNGSFTLGKESVVLKGTWTKNKYRVTYKYQNDPGDIPADAPELPAETTYEWGVPVDTAEAPADTGTANFEGWMSDNNIESDFATSFTMPQEDVTLFGYWTKAPDLTVTYQYEEGKPKPTDAPTLSDDKGSEGDSKIAFAPTSTDIRDGKGNYGTWTLDKWTSPDLIGGVNAGDIYSMPNKDLVLTGTWTFNIDNDFREVKFKIKNGKWADGKTDEIIVPVKLVDGVATLDPEKVPTGMTANRGYGSGKWDVKPNTDKDAITDHVTYTYRFTGIPGVDIPSVDPTPDPDDPTPDPDTPDNPNKPDRPNDPNNPNKPDKPSNPETPDDPADPKTPRTGDTTDLAGLITLLGISIIGLVIGRRKIKR